MKTYRKFYQLQNTNYKDPDTQITCSPYSKMYRSVEYAVDDLILYYKMSGRDAEAMWYGNSSPYVGLYFKDTDETKKYKIIGVDVEDE